MSGKGKSAGKTKSDGGGKKGGEKRKSAPSAATPPPSKKSKSTRSSARASTSAVSSLNEDDLSAASTATASREAELDMASRKLWEHFDPRLGHAWLLAHDVDGVNISEIEVDDREKILDLLVEHRAKIGMARSLPTQLKKLQENFKRLNPSVKSSDIPGMVVVDAEEDDEMEVDEEEEKEERKERRTMPLLPSANNLAHSHRIPPPTSASAFALASATPHPLTVTMLLESCLTCTTPRPAAAGTSWICSKCNLRGDVTADHVANLYLREQMKSSATPAQVATTASSSSTSSHLGQSALEKYTKKLEQFLAQQLREGKTHEGFTSAAAMTTKEAMKKVRDTAFKANDYEHQSDLLIQLIRENKLKELGFALPSRITDINAREDSITDQLTFVSGTGAIVASKNRVVAPAIDSPLKLLEALASTIVPALIDRPSALIQWMSIIRSMIEIHRDTNEWSRAMEFLAQQLHNCIASGDELAVVKLNHIQTIINKTTARTQQFPHSSHAITPSASSYSSQPLRTATAPNNNTTTQYCREWNFKATCSRGVSCAYAHSCKYYMDGKECDGKHVATACPHHVAKTPFSQQRLADSSSRRNRRTSAAAAASGSATVVTAATSAASLKQQ
jgi:hypothetical protein